MVSLPSVIKCIFHTKVGEVIISMSVTDRVRLLAGQTDIKIIEYLGQVHSIWKCNLSVVSR